MLPSADYSGVLGGRAPQWKKENVQRIQSMTAIWPSFTVRNGEFLISGSKSDLYNLFTQDYGRKKMEIQISQFSIIPTAK